LLALSLLMGGAVGHATEAPVDGSECRPAEREPIHLRVLDPAHGLGWALVRDGFDVTLDVEGRLELLADDRDEKRLAALGIACAIDRDLFPGASPSRREGNLDPEYHTVDEMLAELRQLETDHPEICKVYDVGDAESKGYTWDNYEHAYDIWGLRITDNPETDEPEPCVVYDARHHAREPVSTELVLAVARYYCQNYGLQPSVKQTVDRTEIWIIPMVNPDGHQWVEDRTPSWRKNLYDTNGNHHVDSNEGIDPNRNYDWHWALTDWWSTSFGGPAPWTAPEVVSLRELHERQRTCLNATIHSYGEWVFHPFGYGVDPEPVVSEVATELGNRLGYVARQVVTPIYGVSMDWVYGSLGAVGLTVETGTEFIPTGPDMLQLVQQLLPGCVWLATRAWGPSIQGTVTDAASGEPLLATIHIPEIQNEWGDGELRDMQTEATTGYFCRLRPQRAEAITLEVSAPGHAPASVAVTTGGSEATVLDIALAPLTTVVPSDGEVARILGSNVPNPFTNDTDLRFMLPRRALVAIHVYDLTGRAVATLVDEPLEAGTHVARWDGRDGNGRDASPGVYTVTLRAGAYASTRRVALLR
jgi:hypothetical protein